jgi:hypothetical protein
VTFFYVIASRTAKKYSGLNNIHGPDMNQQFMSVPTELKNNPYNFGWNVPVRQSPYNSSSSVLRTNWSMSMEAILKVISFFIALFMIVNGVYVMYMPPTGDEPQGLAIIVMGVFVFIVVMWISQLQDAFKPQS